MHTHRPATINRIRAGVLWVLRGIALGMLMAGALLIVKRLAFGISTRQMDAAWMHYNGVGEWHEFSLGLALLGIGGVTAFAARNLARWVISLPPEDCPRCQYAGIVGDMDRCPECGLTGFRADKVSETGGV